MSAKHGVAQAIFPEGRITRDGHMLPAKLGLLGWLSGVEADPEFEGRLTFVPVGVNYDWVLEDYNLVAEAEGRPEKKGIAHRLQVIVASPFIFFGLLLINGVRRLTGRLKLHGYASLSFGEPVNLKAFMEERGVRVADLDYEERKPHIAALGQHLIDRLGRAVPATPVIMLSMAILDQEKDRFTRQEATSWMISVYNRFNEVGIRFVHGKEFGRMREALSMLEEHHRHSGEELLDIGRGLVVAEEAEEMVRLAVDVMRRNKLIRRVARGTYEVRNGKHNFLRYYANSVAHRLGKRYEPTPHRQSPAADPLQAT